MGKQNQENNKIYNYRTTVKQSPNEQNKISNNNTYSDGIRDCNIFPVTNFICQLQETRT